MQSSENGYWRFVHPFHDGAIWYRCVLDFSYSHFLFSFDILEFCSYSSPICTHRLTSLEAQSLQGGKKGRASIIVVTVQMVTMVMQTFHQFYAFITYVCLFVFTLYLVLVFIYSIILLYSNVPYIYMYILLIILYILRCRKYSFIYPHTTANRMYIQICCQQEQMLSFPI